MHKIINPWLAAVVVVLAVVLIAYLAGVRIWVSNTPAFPNQAYDLGVAGAYASVGGGWSIGYGHRAVNICLGCKSADFSDIGGNTNYDYGSAAGNLRSTNDRDSGLTTGASSGASTNTVGGAHSGCTGTLLCGITNTF